MDESPQMRGLKNEGAVASKLSNMGYFVRRMPYNSPFDLMVESFRTEVKHAEPTTDGEWKVNLHRHGVLDESRVDVYVFVLDKIPGLAGRSLYLTFPAPLGVTTKKFSLGTIWKLYSENVGNWAVFGNPSRRSPDALLAPTAATSTEGVER